MSNAARPLLSASLIVKDEEVMLPRCLASLRGVVDEIVVVDTGSADRTVEIAEAAGARVHRSSWYDDFGRSRNEALERCTGRWVVYVDADEVLQVEDVEAFRAGLARASADAFTVQIDNVEDHGGAIAFTHDPIRLFRRTRFTFEGRIHEHVVTRGGPPAVVAAAEGIRIRHEGYIPDVVAAKGKVQRNAAIAQAAWEARPDDLLVRTELARSLTSTDRLGEALDHIRALRAAGGPTAATALHLGLKVLARQGELEEALAWAEAIEAADVRTVESSRRHAEVLVALTRYEEALAVLERLPADDGAGVHGTHQTETGAHVLRGQVLAALGREDEALEVLLAVAPVAPDAVWPVVVQLLHDRGQLDRGVAAFFDGLAAIGPDRARGVMSELSLVAPELGDAFFEAVAAHPGGMPYGLAFAVANAERLDVGRAAAWSAVAHAAGLPESCALTLQVESVVLSGLQRLLAAVALAQVVPTAGDRAAAGVQEAAMALDDEDVAEALYAVAELAPEVLPALVEGFVTSQRRALVMADALVALGADAQAAMVLQYGLDACTPDPFSLDAITDQLTALGAVA
jgi:tetratricopeptide (TPR) repeat protein